jgi:division protein CdvB (Snf7/Vps24/ESCRT-III family)
MICIDETQPQIVDLKLQDADSKLQIVDSELQNSDLKLQNLDSELQNLDLKLQNPDSELQNLDLKLQNFDSKLRMLELKLQDTDSKLQNHVKMAGQTSHHGSATAERNHPNTPRGSRELPCLQRRGQILGDSERPGRVEHLGIHDTPRRYSLDAIR